MYSRKHPIVGPLINSFQGIDLDNVAYLLLDHDWVNLGSPFDDMQSFAQAPSKPFDAYRQLKFIDDQWAFTDGEQIRDLLYFRAMSYQRIYHNPWNRAKEAFISRELKKLHQQGVITTEMMLMIDDTQFQEILAEHLDQKTYENFFWMGVGFEEVDREYDLTKFNQLEAQYRDDQNKIAYKFKPPRPATDTLVQHQGEVVSFEQAFPEDAGRIQEIIDSLNYVGIFERRDQEGWINEEDLVNICQPRIFNRGGVI